MILPDFNVPFKIHTDASNLAVGVVQDRDVGEHVVSYASMDTKFYTETLVHY